MLCVRAFPRKTRFSRSSPTSYRFVVRFFALTPRFVEGRPPDFAARVALRSACRSRHSIGYASLSGEGPHRVSSAFVPDFEKSVGHFSTGTLPSSEESVFRSALLVPGSKNPKNNKIVFACLFPFECPADARPSRAGGGLFRQLRRRASDNSPNSENNARSGGVKFQRYKEVVSVLPKRPHALRGKLGPPAFAEAPRTPERAVRELSSRRTPNATPGVLMPTYAVTAPV